MKISVIIPTYRRPDLLDRLLISVREQTLPPAEVIVVDDCSVMNDQYQVVIDKHRKNIKSLKIIFLEKNGGAPKARNIGISEAKQEWITLVDDDDEWLPLKLERQAELTIKSNDKLGLIYTWAQAVGANGLDSYESCYSHKGDLRGKLLATNFIMSASVMVRRSAIIKAGLFDEKFPSCQDWDTWVNIMLAGYEAEVIPEVLTIYHRHGGESIGLSKNAKRGYKLFIEKHWKDILFHTSPLNWLKKVWLYRQVWNS